MVFYQVTCSSQKNLYIVYFEISVVLFKLYKLHLLTHKQFMQKAS